MQRTARTQHATDFAPHQCQQRRTLAFGEVGQDRQLAAQGRSATTMHLEKVWPVATDGTGTLDHTAAVGIPLPTRKGRATIGKLQRHLALPRQSIRFDQQLELQALA